MSGDRLSFLSNQTEDEPAEEIADAAPQQEAPETPAEPATPPASAPAPAQPAPTPGQARDDKGRFAPGQKGEDDGAPPAPDQRALEGRLVAMLEERDKRKAAEQAAAHWQRQFEDLRRQQMPRQQVPDVVQDQEGYQRHIEYEMNRRLDLQEAEFSKSIALREFGPEAVEAALQAAQQSGAIEHFRQGLDRWSAMVRWHKAQTTLSEVGDPTEYRRKIEAETRQKVEAELAAKYAPAPPPVPPTSLASAPGQRSGGDPAPLSDQEAFSNAFRRRPIGR